MKPLIKRVGGKVRQAAAIVLALGPLDAGGTYYEPFLGGAAVYLHRVEHEGLRRAVLSDADPALIGAYRAIRTDPEQVIAGLATLPWGADYRERYNEVRATFNEQRFGDPDDPEQAARLIWLNRACFNGLSRVNRAGAFNVPAGSYKALRAPQVPALRNLGAALRLADLRCCSYRDVVGAAGARDQVYADPPFLPAGGHVADGEAGGDGFASYTVDGFDRGTHTNLAAMLAGAAGRGARVVAHNHATRFALELYAGLGFRAFEFEARRSVSRDATKREPAREVMFTAGGTDAGQLARETARSGG